MKAFPDSFHTDLYNEKLGHLKSQQWKTRKFLQVFTTALNSLSNGRVDTGSCQPFNMFKDLDCRVDGNVARNNAMYQPLTCANVSSGSDHCPSTSNSDAQVEMVHTLMRKLYKKSAERGN